jgi:phenylacetate-CoA ligase
MENERGELIPSLETAMLELIAADSQGVGELVVTTLTNDFMPLLRYRIGDLARVTPHQFYTGYELHGRVADALVTPDGEIVTVRQVDDCFAGVAGVAHYQLRQDRPDSFVLWHVPDQDGLTGDAERELRARLQARLGGTAKLAFKRTDTLLSEPSGKFRLTLPGTARISPVAFPARTGLMQPRGNEDTRPDSSALRLHTVSRQTARIHRRQISHPTGG